MDHHPYLPNQFQRGLGTVVFLLRHVQVVHKNKTMHVVSPPRAIEPLFDFHRAGIHNVLRRVGTGLCTERNRHDRRVGGRGGCSFVGDTVCCYVGVLVF